LPDKAIHLIVLHFSDVGHAGLNGIAKRFQGPGEFPSFLLRLCLRLAAQPGYFVAHGTIRSFLRGLQSIQFSSKRRQINRASLQLPELQDNDNQQKQQNNV